MLTVTEHSMRETESEIEAATTTVELPEGLTERVEARLERSEFDAVDEYVAYVLQEVLARVEDDTETETADAVDQDEVETRLQSLGYLD